MRIDGCCIFDSFSRTFYEGYRLFLYSNANTELVAQNQPRFVELAT